MESYGGVTPPHAIYLRLPIRRLGNRKETLTMSEKFYLTTAIAYASRKPHFGNTYEAIMSDAVARYQRMCGKDVFFCTGTDEHGQKIEDLAKDAGITPKAYVDGVAG